MQNDTIETLKAMLRDYKNGVMSLDDLMKQTYLVGSIDGNEAMLNAFDRLREEGIDFATACAMLRQKYVMELLDIALQAEAADVECDA